MSEPTLRVVNDEGRVVAEVPITALNGWGALLGADEDVVWTPGRPLEPIVRRATEFKFHMTPDGQEWARRVGIEAAWDAYEKMGELVIPPAPLETGWAPWALAFLGVVILAVALNALWS